MADEDTEEERPDAGKELKVRLPMALHLKLHTAKLLKGQLISDTVRIALERYFREEPLEAPALGRRPRAEDEEEETPGAGEPRHEAKPLLRFAGREEPGDAREPEALGRRLLEHLRPREPEE